MKGAALLLALAFMLSAGPRASAEDPPAVSTRELVWAEPVEFPRDTMMLVETGCSHCDIPGTGFYRVYRGSGTEMRIDPISIPGDRDYVNSFAFSPDGNFGAAAVCIAVCEYNTLASFENEYRFYFSDDGGITWRDVGTRRGIARVAGATS